MICDEAKRHPYHPIGLIHRAISPNFNNEWEAMTGHDIGYGGLNHVLSSGRNVSRD